MDDAIKIACVGVDLGAMRNSGPVTQVDHPLRDDDLLISRTDPRGIIEWANEGFCRIAQFDIDELVGKPHNLVRHPDMPRAAFKDLWDTVKLGHAWRGLVKNRCKNGDHYWVEADVTPIRRGGQVVGYLSIRGKPDGAERRSLEPVYAQMCRDEGTGKLREPGWLDKLRAGGVPVEVRVGVPFAALAVLALDPTFLSDVAQRVLAVGAIILGALSFAQVFTPLAALRAVVRSADLHARIPLDKAGPLADLARSFNITQQRFLRIVGEFGRQGRSLATAVTEIRQANEDLSARTEQQAANLEESAAGIEELAASIDITARQASAAADAARQARDGTAEGRRAFEELVANVRSMHESSGQVGEIIGVVDEIAFQTNLLALNAAVEAARAGENGRGFAVVANEVRSLALRSSAAARQIRDLVSQSQERAGQGVAAAQGASTRIVAVAAQAEEVSNLMEGIAAATREQSRGLGEMSKAVAQLDTLTQQNASLVQELASSSASLEDQAREMNQLVECFAV